MRQRFCSVARLLTIGLVLLSISPITAPFSAFDLTALLDGTVPGAAVSAKPKSTADDHGVALAGSVKVTLGYSVDRWLRSSRDRAVAFGPVRHRPLRI